MDKIKNKRKNKFKAILNNNQDLLIKHLREEWKEAEETFVKQKKKEQLIESAKNTGITAGKLLLALLAVGGVLTVAAVAPNVFFAFGKLFDFKKRRYFDKKQFNKDKKYLKRHSLIKIKKINKDTFELYLTEKGKNKSIEEAFKNFKILKPQKDGYWRVVMFDIPRKHNWARDIFRQKLKGMGFHQLQESVFILSYPCEKEVLALAEILNIVDFVYLIRTKDFDDNQELKNI